jgi:hypothetical protein
MNYSSSSLSENRIFDVGDTISFTLLDGEPVRAMAVKQENDGMLFILLNCLKTEYQMNRTNTNDGGYEESDLRQILNTEIVLKFPNDVFRFLALFEDGDFLRIPTEREIFGMNCVGDEESDNIEQLEPMKERRNRLAFSGEDEENEDFECYWLQNNNKLFKGSTETNFVHVYWDGVAGCRSAADHNGVRPMFKIKK